MSPPAALPYSMARLTISRVSPQVLETIRRMPPLEGFNHSFLDSAEPRKDLLARADVILVVPASGADGVRALAQERKASKLHMAAVHKLFPPARHVVYTYSNPQSTPCQPKRDKKPAVHHLPAFYPPFPALGDSMALADELWTLPLPQVELSFRFKRWQECQKQRLDLWQTSQYLEATINSTPSLVWYKDKDGNYIRPGQQGLPGLVAV